MATKQITLADAQVMVRAVMQHSAVNRATAQELYTAQCLLAFHEDFGGAAAMIFEQARRGHAAVRLCSALVAAMVVS